MWDPGQYRRFGDERSRPFFDLVGRVDAAPEVVVDLGCGPGTLTAALARRWPQAAVRGIDSSAEMIEAAQTLRPTSPRLSFALGDVRDWKPDGRVDVIFSNAVLQWVPDHLDVVARWAGFLPSRCPGTMTSRAIGRCGSSRARTGGARCWPTCG